VNGRKRGGYEKQILNRERRRGTGKKREYRNEKGEA